MVVQNANRCNHTEANISLRRKCAAYRRKTNTYAKKNERLQQRLNLIWIKHNFVDKHYTTKIVPAVELNIINAAFSFEQLFNIRIMK